MTLPPPRDFVRTTLKPRHRPLVRAVAEAMFAHDEGPTSERLDAFVDEFDAFVSFASRPLRMGLMLMLEVVRFAPLFLALRLSTFTSLPRVERSRILERMERSRIILFTLVFEAYKAMFSLLFFEHEEEIAASGYTRHRLRHIRGLPLRIASGATP